MSFCIKKYLVFSLRKSNNTKYYRTICFPAVSWNFLLAAANQLLANQKDQPYFASAWKQKGRTGTKSTLDHRYFGLGLFRKRLWDRGYN